MTLRDRWQLHRYCLAHPDPDDRRCAHENAGAGIDLDFRLPYPCPRNEHEDGMNMVAVQAAVGRPVISGRADW